MAKKTVAVIFAIFGAFLLLISGFFLGRRSVRAIKVSTQFPGQEAQTAAQQPSHPEQPAADTAAAERLNINTATAEQLQQLPGIGETFAARIVAYREEHGAFSGTSELMNVEGIGETRYEAIKDYITVR